TLGQHLTDERSAASAKRGANRQLALARCGADEQKIGDVGAGDQQDKHHRAHQGQNRGANFSDDVRRHRLDANSEIGGLLYRNEIAQIRRELVGLRLRYAEVRIRLEAPDETKKDVESGGGGVVDTKNLIEVGLFLKSGTRLEDETQIGGCDADDSRGVA